jgi:hypothetical protein
MKFEAYQPTRLNAIPWHTRKNKEAGDHMQTSVSRSGAREQTPRSARRSSELGCPPAERGTFQRPCNAGSTTAAGLGLESPHGRAASDRQVGGSAHGQFMTSDLGKTDISNSRSPVRRTCLFWSHGRYFELEPAGAILGLRSLRTSTLPS